MAGLYYANGVTQLPNVPGVTGQYVRGGDAGPSVQPPLHPRPPPGRPSELRPTVDVRRIQKIEKRMEVVEKANHALFDEASRLQGDLKSALDMQAASFAAATNERNTLKSETARNSETYAQEMQVVIDHVKRTDARAAAAEKRSSELEEKLQRVEAVLQAHIARQQPTMQALHAGVALSAQQTENLNRKLQEVHNTSGTKIETVSTRCQTLERDLSELRRGAEQSKALWTKQASTDEALGVHIAGLERSFRETTARLDAKLLSTVAGSSQAFGQRVDSVAAASTEAIREAVSRLESAMEVNRHGAEHAREQLRKKLAFIETAVQTQDRALKSEVQNATVQLSTAIASLSQRHQQLAAQVAAETQSRESDINQLVASSTSSNEAATLQAQQFENGLQALSAELAREATTSKTGLLKQAEVLERLAESTRQRFEDMRNEWDMRADRQQSELNNEIASLKVATGAVVSQLDQGSQLLERELGATRESLSQVINAEIRSRQRKEEKLEEGLMKLNEQDTAQHFEATSSVDQLAEITTKVCDELQRKIENGLHEQKELLNNLQSGTQTRLEQIVTHIGQSESTVAENIAGITDDVAQERKLAATAVEKLENRTVRQVEILEKKVDLVPLQIHDAIQQLQLLKAEVMGRMDQEAQQTTSNLDTVHLALARKADAVALDRTVESVRGRLGIAEEKTLEVEHEVKRLKFDKPTPPAGTMADTFKMEELTGRVRSLEENMIRCMEHLAEQLESPRRSTAGGNSPSAHIPAWAFNSIEEDAAATHEKTIAEDGQDQQSPVHPLPTVREEDEEESDSTEDASETESDSEYDNESDGDDRDEHESRLSAVLEESEPDEAADGVGNDANENRNTDNENDGAEDSASETTVNIGEDNDDEDNSNSVDQARAGLWKDEVERIRDTNESAASEHSVARGSVSSERSGKMRLSQYERTGMTDDDLSSSERGDSAVSAVLPSSDGPPPSVGRNSSPQIGGSPSPFRDSQASGGESLSSDDVEIASRETPPPPTEEGPQYSHSHSEARKTPTTPTEEGSHTSQSHPEDRDSSTTPTTEASSQDSQSHAED